MDKEINTGVVLPIVRTPPKIAMVIGAALAFFYVDLSPCGYAIAKDKFIEIQTNSTRIIEPSGWI